METLTAMQILELKIVGYNPPKDQITLDDILRILPSELNKGKHRQWHPAFRLRSKRRLNNHIKPHNKQYEILYQQQGSIKPTACRWKGGQQPTHDFHLE